LRFSSGEFIRSSVIRSSANPPHLNPSDPLPSLKIEHAAFNVPEPEEMAAWYVENLGMRVARHTGGPTQIHFLADAAGTTVLELYHNPAAAIPDYPAMHPMQMHIAFACDQPDAARVELEAAGAAFEDATDLADGSRLVMMRDPWGVPVQLVRRAVPLVGG
jgi:glyoxylase I family protein